MQIHEQAYMMYNKNDMQEMLWPVLFTRPISHFNMTKVQTAIVGGWGNNQSTLF